MENKELFTFGEVGSPETNEIYVPLGKNFQCPCGEILNHGGAWLAAHFDEKLRRTCEKCGQLFFAKSGYIRLSKKISILNMKKNK